MDFLILENDGKLHDFHQIDDDDLTDVPFELTDVRFELTEEIHKA